MTNDQLHNHSGAFLGMHAHDGGAAHWHDEFGAHNAEDLTPEEFAARQLDWRMHNAQVVTIGMDIGSSTSHLMFSKVFMQLLGEPPHVRSVVVGREILAESPIVMTPYLPDNTIDVAALRQLVDDAYAASGATADDVDSGAIILTGEALKRDNARNLAEMFAVGTGKFVCASAGHHLEAVLAANGSGTVSRSRRDQRTLLNVDIGGGTTKFAIVREGEIVATAAVAIGARLIVLDSVRRPTRIDGPAHQIARHLGIDLALGEPLSFEDETRIVEAWADILAGIIDGRPLEGIAAELMVTEPLRTDIVPQAMTLSGGVSEFFFFREHRDFGDLGLPLARQLRQLVSDGTIALPVIMDPNLGIRATAVGASLFTVQVGVNLYVSDESMLPLRNVPVIAPRLDFEAALVEEHVAEAVREALDRLDLEDGEQPVAIALAMEEELSPEDLDALVGGIRRGLPRTCRQAVPLVVASAAPIGDTSIGAALKRDPGVEGDVLSFENVLLKEFDFIDIATVIHPTEVVPVTVKSLLFAGGLDRRSVKQALYDAAIAQAADARRES